MTKPARSETAPVAFALYEAILWEPPAGYFLLERHLERLAGSSRHFGFALDLRAVRRRLAEHAAGLRGEARKVRLELQPDGALALSDQPVRPSAPVEVALAREPVRADDELLRHKTSRRGVFERALASRPEVGDVVLWNERGELTETCTGNLVLELEGRRLTPALASGLLPGVFRAHLLERGELEEAILPVSALERARGLLLVNSVRRWCELRLRS
jgi:para-aminobenzoate synthetase/4-amino-4-deoxychorismate lyase